MPFCDTDRDVSLYYITNTPKGDTTDLNPSKQTIILLPPIFHSVTWLREQFKDLRLSCHYNLIAFDQRNMGSTKAQFHPERDAWVDAADLAVAHESLKLPPCHIFAVATNAGGAALRFAALFPDKCLSLGLCACPVQPGEDPEWVEQGIDELFKAYCFPKDMDDVERAYVAFSWHGFTGQVSTELEDEIVAWWQMNLPPTKRTSFLAQGSVAVNRARLSDEEIGAIKHPTIIIQGDKSFVSPPARAQAVCDKLPNGRLIVVKGGPELMNIVPEYASVVNRIYSQFLAGLKNTTATPPCEATTPNPGGILKAGLERLAMLAHNPSIADRDPMTPLSFSRVSAEVVEKISIQFAEYALGESEAFHALDNNGRPIRKFSERHGEGWESAYRQRYFSPETDSIIVFRTTSISE